MISNCRELRDRSPETRSVNKIFKHNTLNYENDTNESDSDNFEMRENHHYLN